MLEKNVNFIGKIIRNEKEIITGLFFALLKQLKYRIINLKISDGSEINFF